MCFFGSLSVYAQLSYEDSLKNALSLEQSDTGKVALIIKLIEPFRSKISNAEKMGLAQSGYDMAKQIGFEKGQADCALLLGFDLVHQDVFKAIILFNEAKKISEKNKDTLNLIRSLAFLGYATNSLDFRKSLTYYYVGWELMKKVKLDDESFLPIYAPLGYAYKDAGILDTALLFLRKGFELSFNGKSAIKSNSYYKHFGEIYYKLGNYDSAMYYLRRADLYAGEVQYYIALIKKHDNQLDSAKYYAKVALTNEVAINRLEYIIPSANLLYDMYKDTDSMQALQYRLIALEAKDKFYSKEKAQEVERIAFEERERDAETKHQLETIQARNRFYILLGILAGASLLVFILYRNNRLKHKTNQVLIQQKQEIDLQKTALQKTVYELKMTQSQLIQKEKLASLGELTAGIAHEIQNPLNFVNNFSSINSELITELNTEIEKGNIGEAKSLAVDIKENSNKINHHGLRASNIVKGMLEHSRKSSGEKTLTDINALCDEYLRLSYHGLRAKDKSFNADFKLDLDPNMPKINVVSQDIARVLLNLINNAFQACDERSRVAVNEKQQFLINRSTGDLSQKTNTQELGSPSALPINDEKVKAGVWGKDEVKDISFLPPAPKARPDELVGRVEQAPVYKPLVNISTKYVASLRPEASGCEINISDNGSGIPDHIRDKIFQPFFTTKPTGQGTGLGLSLAYDIVKAHGGKIEVNTHKNGGTEFKIILPI